MATIFICIALMSGGVLVWAMLVLPETALPIAWLVLAATVACGVAYVMGVRR